MTDEEFGFIRAVVEDPDNDTPRLLYADWLDEQGDPAASARAEFIRIQCQLARDHTRHRLLEKHRQRERELLRAYQARWVAEVAHTNLVSTCRFHRGFLTGIGLPAHQFFTLAPRLFRLAPIQQLTVYGLTEVGVASLAYTPECSRLTALVLDGNRITDAGVRVLANSPYLHALRELSLCGNQITDLAVLVDMLQRLPLQVLRLDNNPIDVRAQISNFQRLAERVAHISI